MTVNGKPQHRGTVELIRADARDLPLADESVDLIVTSPPYFALRSYRDGGKHYDEQVGSEATPDEYLDAMIECTREMMRVLKSSGSIFVNIGDKYFGTIGGPNNNGYSSSSTLNGPAQIRDRDAADRAYRIDSGVKPKSLIGIPWRYALRCVDDLGLILRAEIIWAKPNGLPESVVDRVSRKHEQWFHFTKNGAYYSAIDEIRERLARTWDPTKPNGNTGSGAYLEEHLDAGHRGNTGIRSTSPHPLGKIPGSVWSINTEPLVVDESLGVDHFAAFPIEWPRRLILGWSPPGICTKCGVGRRPVVDKATTGHDNNSKAKEHGRDVAGSKIDSAAWKRIKDEHPDRITAYECDCPEPNADTRPAIVLDPFGGTGTTAAVAKAMGRCGISVDLSSDYLRLAEWRTSGDGYGKVRATVRGRGDALGWSG